MRRFVSQAVVCSLLLGSAMPATDVDARFEEATDAHRRAQQHRLIKDYEQAMAGYAALLEHPATDEERRIRVAFYRAEIAWDLGQWEVAFDGYRDCAVVGHQVAFDCAFNRVLAAKKIMSGAIVSFEMTPEGRRVARAKKRRRARRSPRRHITTRARPLDEDASRLLDAALDYRALVVASGPGVGVRALLDGATIELAMARLVGLHGQLDDAQQHLDLAREQWRDYEARWLKEKKTQPAAAPDFDGLQRRIDAAFASRAARDD